VQQQLSVVSTNTTTRAYLSWTAPRMSWREEGSVSCSTPPETRDDSEDTTDCHTRPTVSQPRVSSTLPGW
jgi:hypothetical protein